MSLKDTVYMDKNRGIEERIKDLLARMTVEEKIYQMCCVGEDEILRNGKLSPRKAKKNIGKGIGEITPVLRDINPKEGAKLANQIQKFAAKNTRLGIPVIIHDECLHGCMAKNSASFPQPFGACSGTGSF